MVASAWPLDGLVRLDRLGSAQMGSDLVIVFGLYTKHLLLGYVQSYARGNAGFNLETITDKEFDTKTNKRTPWSDPVPSLGSPGGSHGRNRADKTVQTRPCIKLKGLL
jgi:hypothetical protein